MVSIVQYYSQYSPKTTREHYKAAKAKFDHYNVNNDAAVCDFLLDLLELKLHDMVSEKLEDDNGFLVTWLQLIKSIQMTNIEHYETLNEQVEACCPSQFPGQNVTTLASTFRAYARELDNAYAYDHNLTLMMLKTFLLAGGNDNKDYKMDLCITKKELKKELKIVHHMGYDEAKEHMTKQDLTYKSICEVTENAYSEQADRSKWPPARNIHRDSAAPPASFHAIAPTDRTYTSAEINALFQTKMGTQPTSSKSGNCNRCGKPGHWARECPNKSHMDTNENNSNNGGHNGGSGCSNGSARGGNVNAHSSSNTQDNGQNQHNTQNWKYIAPTPGQSQCKVANGTTFEWCGKCKHWTTSHNTDSHGKQHEANMCLVPDPSIWSFRIDSALSLHDLWTLLGPMIMSFICGFMASGIWVYAAEITSFIQAWQWTMAPILWLAMLFTISFHRPSEKPPFDHQEHRFYAKQCHCHSHHPKYHTGSIRDHGLHRKYPIHLCSKGLYVNCKAPTYFQLTIMLQLKTLHSQVLCILQCVKNRGHAPVQTVQKGGIWSNDKISPMHRANHNCKKWCSHPCHGPWYEPAVSSCHGNNHGTQHQEHAVKKIITQVHMATTGPNAHDINPALYHAALLSPSQFRSALPNEPTFWVIWDLGVSILVSYDECDFVRPLKKPGFTMQLKGITSGLQIEGEGHIMWAMHDTDGMLWLI